MNQERVYSVIIRYNPKIPSNTPVQINIVQNKSFAGSIAVELSYAKRQLASALAGTDTLFGRCIGLFLLDMPAEQHKRYD